jgi:hypothetical protein
MKTLLIIILLLFATMSYGADVVQIATTRDVTGTWNNWVVQAVTWDTVNVATIGDHIPVSTKVLQTWYFPIDTGWLKATFSRTLLGVYGLRWSRDGELWSNAESVAIENPANARSR